MGIEIERKFLVHEDKWKKQLKPAGTLIRQGYLSVDPERNIRVRLKGETGWLCIKGKMSGRTRSEFEYEIPYEDAKELFENLSVAIISKIRYDIYYHNKHWEVDEFLDNNAGLILAELELETEKEIFDIPDWVENEVTNDEKYYNVCLALKSYNKWTE